MTFAADGQLPPRGEINLEFHPPVTVQGRVIDVFADDVDTCFAYIAGESHARFVRFSVQDDGCGFDPTCRPRQEDGHFGLDGVQERLNRLNGKLDIESSPGKGTYVRLTINHAQQDTPA